MNCSHNVSHDHQPTQLQYSHTETHIHTRVSNFVGTQARKLGNWKLCSKGRICPTNERLSVHKGARGQEIQDVTPTADTNSWGMNTTNQQAKQDDTVYNQGS